MPSSREVHVIPGNNETKPSCRGHTEASVSRVIQQLPRFKTVFTWWESIVDKSSLDSPSAPGASSLRALHARGGQQDIGDSDSQGQGSGP